VKHVPALLVIFVTLVLTVAAARFWSASDHLTRDVDAFSRISEQSQKLMRLRSSQRVPESDSPVTLALPELISDILVRSGSAASVLESLRPVTESGSSSGSSMMLQLRAIAPDELGAFLSHWDRLGSGWRAERLELRAQLQQPGRYDVSVIVRTDRSLP